LLYTPGGSPYRPGMKRALVLAGLALLSAVARTAAAQPAPPPPIGDIDKPAAFLYYLVAIVLLGVVIVLSIMPSKRREDG